jgi:cellulose synthase (UDP-forming)
MVRETPAFVPMRARDPTHLERFLLWLGVGWGVLATVDLAHWWFTADHVAVPLLFVTLSAAFWYGIVRILLGWYSCLHVTHPPDVSPPPGLAVAIFTTAMPGDPLDMIDRTLGACAQVRYPHATYLLDDTRDPRYASAAQRHGATHLELLDLPGAKAGKINAALARTRETFVLVLDPDHVPFPEFFDRTLGHFADPHVGFVQVSQAYYNQAASFVARGAAEQTYAFYGPTLSGMYGAGTSIAVGANCVFRRAALESIGGHGVGLAEDLITSILLHACGWKSVYLPEVLSRGLVPEDVGSFQRQQLKWARGVYEMLFSYYPRCFRRLTWHQRIAYLSIGTYYLSGVATAVSLILPFTYLWTGLRPANMFMLDFVQNAAPVGLLGVFVFFLAQRWYCDPASERGVPWRSTVLKLGCWPSYVRSLVFALAGVAVRWVPTAKTRVRRSFFSLAWPHLLVLMLFFLTFIFTVTNRLLRRPLMESVFETESAWTMLVFAGMHALVATGMLYAAWEAARPLRRGARGGD